MKGNEKRKERQKFFSEARQAARKLSQEGAISRAAIAAQLGVSPRTIREWLGPVGTRIIHPKELRIEAAKLEKGGVGRADIERRLGVSRNALSRWLGPASTTVEGLKRQALRAQARNEAVRLAVEDGLSRSAIAKILKVPKATIRGWLGPATTAANYEELRVEAARLREEGLPRGAIAKKLGVSGNFVSKWVGANPNHEIRAKEIKELKPKVLQMAESDEGMSNAAIARKFGLSATTVGRWLNQARRISHKKKHIRYSDAVKQEAIRLLGTSLNRTEVARQLDVSLNVVSIWFRAALAEGVVAKPSPKKAKYEDFDFTWIKRECPEYAAWQEPMAEWLKSKYKNIGMIIRSLRRFIVHYLAGQSLPSTPAELMRRKTTPLPNFFMTVCQGDSGVSINNIVHNFLQWVLIRDFSVRADDGTPVPSPAFFNPVERVSSHGIPARNESDKEPLPYGYIADARRLLAQGAAFGDWTWAQTVLGDEGGHKAADWYEVREDEIDKNDPDCVWRLREFLSGGRPPVLEMWSPVRWVALLIKLQLPSRTFQVRMLDSGESDTWRYERGRWALNHGQFAEGKKEKTWAQGVFRRVRDSLGNENTVLYFNTNKTRDAMKAGKDKGLEIAWPDIREQSLDNQPYYWLEKVRNWQEKYNPISRRTAWITIPMATLGVTKSEVQLAGYPDACFLFRAAENKNAGKAHLPISNGEVNKAWYKLLAKLEERIAKTGTTHKDGSRVRLIKPDTEATTHFPLHCLRVSLITELATTGGMSMELMVKIAGHSRLLMTLYYTKPSFKYVQDALVSAAERLDANKENSVMSWLANAERDELMKRVVFNANDHFPSLMPEHPASRNPVGWMPMHHGMCLAGGNNASELEPSYVLKGCHNGGQPMPGKGKSAYSAVPGGARNCIRCRWFVTEPHYVPALSAHLGNIFYHFCETRVVAVKHEEALTKLKNEKYDAEKAETPFMKMDELNKTERLYEAAMARIVNLAKDIAACHQLIERCNALQSVTTKDATALVGIGDAMDVHAIVEETDSELLQLCGVCQNVEIYPELDAGKAVYRQSQFLDSLLMREGGIPFFMTLNENEQLKYGNAFMRKLAQQSDSTNSMIGFRRLCGLIDSGRSLTQALGVNVRDLLPAELEDYTKVTPIKVRKGASDAEDCC